MKIKLPDWCLENLLHQGQIQCGYCAMMMQIEGKGDIPKLEYGVYHFHHKDCPKFVKQEKWEAFPIMDQHDGWHRYAPSPRMAGS